MMISFKNSKLGKIMNDSFTPIKSCNPSAIEYCKKRCYARRCYCRLPNVKKSWDHNLKHLQKNLHYYEWQLTNNLELYKPKYFRNFVSGDFTSQEHVEMMFRIARKFPDTKFSAFTKCYFGCHNWNFANKPDNYSIMFGMWSTMPYYESKYPFNRYWVQDGTETRIPKDAILCHKKCDECLVCWNIDTIKKDVYTYIH